MESLEKKFNKLSVKAKDYEEKKSDKNDKHDKTKAPLNTEKTLMTEGNSNESNVILKITKNSNFTPVKIIGNGTFGVVYEVLSSFK